MSIRFSVNRFPENAMLKENSGLPWGCVVQPFISASYDESSSTSEENTENINLTVLSSQISADKVARCSECFGYINPYVKFTKEGWWCSLCHHVNLVPTRYATPKKRQRALELSRQAIEFAVPDETPSPSTSQFSRPIFIACIDLTATYEAIELIKEGLLGALQALPPSSLFGMLVFSEKLGFFNLKSSLPHIKNVMIDPDSSDTIEIEDLLSFDNFLVEISSYELNISVAIESLKNIKQTNSASSLESDFGESSTENLSRGFGDATDTLLQFIESQSLSNVRILNFLCGKPNYGKGSMKASDNNEHSMEPENNYWKDLGKRAVKNGVCVDLYVVTNQFVGLSTIKFISTFTGGGIHLSSDSLPQDLYKKFSNEIAINCLFRIRTSKNFKCVRGYGHLINDQTYDNLYHIESCESWKCFAFDFDFTSPSDSLFKRVPTIQMAFAYTLLPGNQGNSSGVVKRRLRIVTLQVPIGKSRRALYESTDPLTVTSIMCHKMVKVTLHEGMEEARALLKDWMVVTLMKYNEQYNNMFVSQRENPVLDVTFDKLQRLAVLNRFVFGMLNSEILNLVTDFMDSDKIIYLHNLLAGLEPEFLALTIYPNLIVLSDPDTLVGTNYALSRQSLAAGSIYILDCFVKIYMIHDDRSEKEKSWSWPPSKESQAKEIVGKLKQGRSIAPSVLAGTIGSREGMEFEKWLIEDGGGKIVSYQDYLKSLFDELTNLTKKK